MNNNIKTRIDLVTSDELSDYYKQVRREFIDHIEREIAKEPTEIGNWFIQRMAVVSIPSGIPNINASQL